MVVAVLESPVGSWAALGVLVVSAIALVWFTKRKQAGLPFPPGPKAKPLIGNMLDMPQRKEVETFDKWHRQYGDIVHIEVFGQHIVLLNTAETASDLLDHRSAIYSSRPQTVMMNELMGLGEWAFNVQEYGDAWRKGRRLFHAGTQPTVLSAYEPTQMRCARDFVKALFAKPGEVEAAVRRHVGSTIVDVVFGIERRKEYLIEIATEVVSMFAEAAVPGAFIVDTFPALKYLPRWFPGANFWKKADRMRFLLDEMRQEPIKEIRKAMDAGEARPSMVSQLLGNSEQEKDVMDFACIAYGSGMDTTASTILFFFLAMARFPEAQARAHAEIDQVVGGDRLPEFDDRANLPWVNAIISEVLRWQPVGPVGLPHALTEDDEYKGYLIPKGSLVMGNARAILHNPEEFPEPEEFRPERFLRRTSDGQYELNKSVRNPSDIAFGFGRRICPGRFFVDQFMFATIVSVLAVYEISAPLDEDGRPVPPKVAICDGMISRPLPFKCTIKPRAAHATDLIEMGITGA